MPSQPVTRTPSFIPTIYPYEIIITLSTETPPSTLKLPQYETVEQAPDTYKLSPSGYDGEMNLREDNRDCSGLDGSCVLHKATSQRKSEAESRAVKASGERLPHVENEGVFLPIYREKAIYRQGKFKWSISTGPGPIDAPPPPENLSDGDVFIRVSINAPQMQRTQVWYLCPTSSSVLTWKAIEPLQDIRYIGNDPYVLALYADEPSWILARSAAHPQIRSRKPNINSSAQPKPTHPKDQQTSGRKRLRCAKGKAGRSE